MSKSLKYKTDIINDVSGFDFDQKSFHILKIIMFQKLFIICRNKKYAEQSKI